MSFREKMHWAALIAILLGFGFYFTTLNTIPHTSHEYYFGLLVAIIGFIIAAMTIAAIVFALLNRGDAKAKADERDKLIHARGTHAAYYILLLGAWSVAAAAHFGHGLFFLLNLLLFVIVFAESVRIGAQLYFYRRGY